MAQAKLKWGVHRPLSRPSLTRKGCEIRATERWLGGIRPLPRITQADPYQEVIRKAQSILLINLSEDGFLPYSEAALRRVTTTLKHYVSESAAMSVDLPIPRIVPADEGSIDLFWEIEDRYLAINFPVGGEDATYYGVKPSVRTWGVLANDLARKELITWLVND